MKTAVLLLSTVLGVGSRGEVLEFSSDACMPCQQLAPTITRLEREGLPIRQINLSRPENQERAREFGVAAVPTLILMIDGRERSRKVGNITESDIRAMVARIPAEAPAPPKSPRPHGGLGVELGAPALEPRPPAGRGVVAEDAPRTSDADPPEGRTSIFPFRRKKESLETPVIRGSDRELGARRASSLDDPVAAGVLVAVPSAKPRRQGSGTVIDSRPGRSLIATCGSLFADLGAEAKIEVGVPDGEGYRPFIAELVRVDAAADVALLAINTDQPLRGAPVAPLDGTPRVGDRVVGVGATDGQPLSREQLYITALNKYEGPANIECTGTPLQGRAGGGLFNQDGQLIGVCIASGSEPNRGMFAGLQAVHELLDACELSALYAPETAVRGPHGLLAVSNEAADVDDRRTADERDEPALPRGLAGGVSRGEPAPFPERGFGRQAEELFADLDDPAARADDRVAEARNSGHDDAAADVDWTSSPSRGVRDDADADDQEVVVIIRSKRSPTADSRVMVIHRASPKMLAFLNGELQGASGAVTADSTPRGPAAREEFSSTEARDRRGAAPTGGAAAPRRAAKLAAPRDVHVSQSATQGGAGGEAAGDVALRESGRTLSAPRR